MLSKIDWRLSYVAFVCFVVFLATFQLRAPVVSLASQDLPDAQNEHKAKLSEPEPASPVRLYQSIIGYVEGFHGNKFKGSGSRESTPREQRRDPTVITDQGGAVDEKMRNLQREKHVTRMRVERREWGLALDSLGRASQIASSAQDLQEVKSLNDLHQALKLKSKKSLNENGMIEGETINSIGMKLVMIPAGTFTMGSSAAEMRRIRNEWTVEEDLVRPETPDHKVQISKPFLMGKYDVTVSQFKLFVQETGYKTVAESQGWAWAYDSEKKHWIQKAGVSWRNPGYETGEDYPVTVICHVDAESFCNWLSKREGKRYELPTEAQWEYTARGSKEEQRFSWGDYYPDGKKLNIADRNSPVPWADRTFDDYYGGPSPVGCYDPNGFRLYDMLGNVWQLCSDYYDPKAYQGTGSKLTVDPRGSRSGKRKVVRGGNWAFGAGIARNAFRFGIDPHQCIDLTGFRVARAETEDSLGSLSGHSSSNPVHAEGFAGLLTRVRSLVSGGRRLDARRVVSRIEHPDSVTKEVSEDPGLFVTEVLDALIDLTEDSSTRSFVNSVGMKMLRIPAGAFIMGSSEADIAWAMTTLAQNQPVSLENEYPFHKVRVSRPFFMSETEVTVGQFQGFVEATGYVTDAEDSGGGQVFDTRNNRFEVKQGSSWKNPGWTTSPDQPVTMVSYNDAQAFVEWLSAKDKLPYKLPTEAQWEYAARGGLPFPQFPWGDAVPDGRKANYSDRNTSFEWRDRDADDGYKFVAPVGSYPANGYGLHDMAGNVIEWVRDHYGENYYRFAPEVDPEGPGHGENRVTKGGDWTFGAVSLRCAFRGWSSPDLAFYNTGFRVIVDAAGPQRTFHFASNFLTKEWVPGSEQRAVIEAAAKENDRRLKSEPPAVSSPNIGLAEALALKGVLILDLTPKSDAKKAGLVKGDIIIEYNGTRGLSSEGLLALTARTKKDRIKPIMVFVRDGFEYAVRVDPGFLGVAVMDTTVRGPFKKQEPGTDQAPKEEKGKKLKPEQWT